MAKNALSIQKRIQVLRRIVVGASLAVIVVTIGLLLFVPIDERVLATGKIRAETDTYLYAPADGTLEKVLVREGDSVQENQALLKLNSTHLQQELKQIDAAISRARAQLRLQQVKLEHTTRLPLPREFWHMQEDVFIARESLRQSQVEADRYEELFAKGLVSRQEVERTTLAVELANAEVAKASEKANILNQGLEGTILEEARALIEGARSALQELEVKRTVIEEQVDELTLRAPTAGLITYLPIIRPGKAVQKGESLVHLSQGPANRVDLFVGENQIHRLHKGQRILMESLAFDSLRHGYIEGEVTEVALEPYYEDRKMDSSAATPVPTGETSGKEMTYRLQGKILSTPLPLVIGSSVEAKIILNRIPIWKLLLPEDLRSSN